jgi:excisionase family DNA binding protein
MTSGFNIESLLDALADRVAVRLSQIVGAAAVRTHRLLSVEEAAEYLGRSTEAIRHMISAGKLPTVRGDRRIQIDVRDLDHWIESNKQANDRTL